TVLGQIDPGPVEEDIVARLSRRNPGYKDAWIPAPGSYWDSWREECCLADRIIVNSDWAHRSLLTAGVPDGKLDIIPLAFQPSPLAGAFLRSYPKSFTESRPMRM